MKRKKKEQLKDEEKAQHKKINKMTRDEIE